MEHATPQLGASDLPDASGPDVEAASVAVNAVLGCSGGSEMDSPATIPFDHSVAAQLSKLHCSNVAYE